ncbi:MAG: VOC family protein [Pseudomonadota bacterium]
MTDQTPPFELARRDRCLNYVEFTVTDLERSKAFYGTAFGWSFTDYGPSYVEFFDGQMRGGFEVGAPQPQGGPLVILYGNDLPSLITAIEAAGGTITKPVFPFPGGERFHFTDPDGYELAVWCAAEAASDSA